MPNEKMNPNMEKIFFRHVLEHPEEFDRVQTYFFKNDDIQFVYSILREEFLLGKSKQVPSNQQIVAMVKLRESERKINNDFLKILLKSDNTQYEKDWVLSRFKAWKKSTILRDNIMKSIDYIRGIDAIDYNQVNEVTGKIRNLISDVDMVEDLEDDMGLDFDDPEAHKQDSSVNKIPTGWGSLDRILNGGWDYSTLNVIVAQTSGGKSMMMCNMAVKMADIGKNVVYITLEMADYKCVKRIGSMRLKIPIKEYDEKSKDPIYIKNKINELKSSNGGLFENNIGKIFIKKFPTGACTITDIDLYITKLEQAKKIKIDAILVDYINIMGVEKGDESNTGTLFLKGKHLAEGLRYIADKHDVVLITATQTDKDVWDSNDLELKNIPESKAVAESCDVAFGIIRNPEMRKNNKYKFKPLKLRDGEFSNEIIRFDFNTNFLTMENDELTN